MRNIDVAAKNGKAYLLECFKENKAIVLNVKDKFYGKTYEKTDNLSEQFLRAVDTLPQKTGGYEFIMRPARKTCIAFAIRNVCAEMEKDGYKVERTKTSLKFSR